MSARPSIAERLDRHDRVLWLLAQRAGIGGPGLGPMDPGWRRVRRQAELDLAAIVQEQVEPQLETRGGSMITPDAQPAIVRLSREVGEQVARLAGGLAALVDENRAQWRAVAAALEVDLPEPTDGDELRWIRGLAVKTERAGASSADRIAAEMAEAHAAAKRQTGTPSIRRRYDGTRPRPLDDERDVLAERQRLLGPKSQAAQHAAMGAKPAASWDATDRPETRPVREAIYKKLREQEQ